MTVYKNSLIYFSNSYWQDSGTLGVDGIATFEFGQESIDGQDSGPVGVDGIAKIGIV